jgi:hypothetical protein
LQHNLPGAVLIGCVVYSRASLRDSGEAEILGQQLNIGAVGSRSLLGLAAEDLSGAGIAISEDNIRREVWAKLVRKRSGIVPDQRDAGPDRSRRRTPAERPPEGSLRLFPSGRGGVRGRINSNQDHLASLRDLHDSTKALA